MPGDGGPATSAQLLGPLGLFIDVNNHVYIGDCGSNPDVSVVREVSLPPSSSGPPSVTQPSNRPTRLVGKPNST